MRRAIERIWTMHEACIKNNVPLQEKVLYANILRAIQGSKSRSTREMGIPPLPDEKENVIRFKVIMMDFSQEKKDRLIELLISEVQATWQNEGVSFGLSDEEQNEILELLEQYPSKFQQHFKDLQAYIKSKSSK